MPILHVDRDKVAEIFGLHGGALFKSGLNAE